jgi:hypothetical protein
MKICVITGTYALSGVPLAQMRLSRALGGLGHEVDFAIGMINPGNTTPTLENASTTVFGKARVAAMILPLVRYFRQQKPDVVFSAGDHLNAIVLKRLFEQGLDTQVCDARCHGASRRDDMCFRGHGDSVQADLCKCTPPMHIQHRC